MNNVNIINGLHQGNGINIHNKHISILNITNQINSRSNSIKETSLKEHAHTNYKEKENQYLCKISKLEVENMKMKNELNTYEQYKHLIQELEKHHSYTTNNSTLNWLSFSHICEIWEVIAKENIQNNFIDFFDYPVLCSEIIAKLFELWYNSITTKTEEIINSFLCFCNCNDKFDDDTSLNSHAHLFPGIKAILKEIIKVFYQNIFENANNNSVFVQVTNEFFEFLKAKDQEMFDNFINDFDEQSFRNLFYNIQRVLFFLYFKENIIIDGIFRVCENPKTLSEYKEGFYAIDGQSNKSHYITIINSPTNKKGYTMYKQLKPIVIGCNRNEKTAKEQEEAKLSKKQKHSFESKSRSDVDATKMKTKKKKAEKSWTTKPLITFVNFNHIKANKNKIKKGHRPVLSLQILNTDNNQIINTMPKTFSNLKDILYDKTHQITSITPEHMKITKEKNLNPKKNSKYLKENILLKYYKSNVNIKGRQFSSITYEQRDNNKNSIVIKKQEFD